MQVGDAEGDTVWKGEGFREWPGGLHTPNLHINSWCLSPLSVEQRRSLVSLKELSTGGGGPALKLQLC